MLNRIGLLLYTKFFGQLVGCDIYNNRYYKSKKATQDKRWVVYNGVNDPSKIDAQWFAWLHYIEDTIPSKRKSEWLPNTTGTKFARKMITSIENIPQTALNYYESWSPDK
jgi:NADH:ubiquinone oxidoreductase subunit